MSAVLTVQNNKGVFFFFLKVKNVPEPEVNDWLEFVPDR